MGGWALYSTTIKSDGQLHTAPAPVRPTPSPPPSPPQTTPKKGLSLSGDTLLILAIALLLMQNKKPDWLLLIALGYLLL